MMIFQVCVCVCVISLFFSQIALLCFHVAHMYTYVCRFKQCPQMKLSKGFFLPRYYCLSAPASLEGPLPLYSPIYAFIFLYLSLPQYMHVCIYVYSAYERNMKYLPFPIWLLSLSIITSSSVYFPAYDII